MKAIRAMIGSVMGAALLLALALLALLGLVPGEFIWPLLCPTVLALGLLLPLGPMVGRDEPRQQDWNWR